MSKSKNYCESRSPAISKLYAFCSSHSLFKSEQELRDSFENFFAPASALENAVLKELRNPLEGIRELLPILHDLGQELVDGKSNCEFALPEQSDSSNRLNASLKRHPE